MGKLYPHSLHIFINCNFYILGMFIVNSDMTQEAGRLGIVGRYLLLLTFLENFMRGSTSLNIFKKASGEV